MHQEATVKFAPGKFTLQKFLQLFNKYYYLGFLFFNCIFGNKYIFTPAPSFPRASLPRIYQYDSNALDDINSINSLIIFFGSKELKCFSFRDMVFRQWQYTESCFIVSNPIGPFNRSFIYCNFRINWKC